MTTYTARRTPRDRTGSGWYEILPPAGPARELEGDSTADWVIVGAGFAGLAAAHRLAQLRAGERIVVIDAQRVGWGAAGRNSGFMIDLPHELNSASYAGGRAGDLKQIRMNRTAMDFARKMSQEYDLGAVFNPCGKYHGVAGASGLKALGIFSSHLQALGEPCTRLDRADMKRITGSDFYRGGLHTPGAVIIQPAAFVRGVAEGLRHKVDIYEDSPVVRIETGAEHCVSTVKGKVRARRVILTTNGHAESFGLYRHRLMHIFLYASMTRQLTLREQRVLGGEAEWALIPADPMGSTVRRIREGRILVRNSALYNPELEVGAEPIARAGIRHDKSFRARFPMLGGVTMEYRWGGHLCLSLNSVPAFGEVDDRVYTAVCQNGLGTVKGTLAGMLIAEYAAKVENPLVAEMLANAKPRKLFPEPFMTLGAKTALWWRQQRAGAEL